MKRLALLVFLASALHAQNRFPPINIYTGDPTGVACAIPDSLVQSDSTGGVYACLNGVYKSVAAGSSAGAAGTNTQVQYNNNGILGGSAATLDSTGTFATPSTVSIAASLPFPYTTGACIGDSLTEGAGVPAGQDYCTALSALTGIPFSNQGVPGQTSSDIRARMGAYVAPLTLITSLGTTAGSTATFQIPGSIATATFTNGTNSITATLGAYGFAPANGNAFTGVGVPNGTTINSVPALTSGTSGSPNSTYTFTISNNTTLSPSGSYYWTTATTSVLGYRPCYNSQFAAVSAVFNGSIGGVAGSCLDSGDGVNFTFTRTANGSALTPGNYTWTGNPGSLTAGMNIIWAGTNNTFRPPTVIADIQGIVASLPNGSDYVVLSPLSQNVQLSWGQFGISKQQSVATSAALQAIYQGRFIDVREKLVGAYDSSLVLDTLDYTHDQTPSTHLRATYNHGTLTGGINSTTCTITVSGGTALFTNGESIVIDGENIFLNTNSGTDCIRGYAGSTAASHSLGAAVTGYDGIHLSQTGYADIATWVNQWLQYHAGLTASYATPSPVMNQSVTLAQPAAFTSNRFVYQDPSNVGNQLNFQAGQNAGQSNYSGIHWHADGVNAGASNKNGNEWTAVGMNAGFLNVSGSDWTALGFNAGERALGSQWLAIGPNAALAATGANFHAIGYEAGFKHTSGDGFFAEGWSALFSNLTCARCYASGTSNSFNNQSGDSFTDVGYQGAYNNNGPGPFTGIGTFNGYNSSTGYDWTCVGTSCGYFNMTGSGWTALGRSAGINTDVGGSGTGSWVGAVNPVTIAVTSGAAPTLGAILTGVGIPSNDVVTAVSGAGPYSVTLTAASTVSPVGVYSWSVGGGGAGTSSFTVGVNPVTITVTSGAAPQVNAILVGTNIPANDMITTVSGGGPYTVTLTTAPTGSASGTYYWNGVHSSEWTAVGHLAGANNASGDLWTAVGSNSLLYANSSYTIGLGYNAGSFTADGVTHNVTAPRSIYIGAFSEASADGNTDEIVIGDSAKGHGPGTITLGSPGDIVYAGNTLIPLLNPILFSYVGTTDTVACPNNTTANFATTYSIPANTIKAGTQLRVTLAFSMTATATVPTFSFRMTIGGTSVFVAQPTAPAAVSGNPMSVGATFLIGGTAAASASSAVLTNIIQTATGANSNFSPFSQSAAATANPQQNLATNGSLTIQPILFCGANTAGNSLTLNQVTVEMLHP